MKRIYVLVVSFLCSLHFSLAKDNNKGLPPDPATIKITNPIEGSIHSAGKAITINADVDSRGNTIQKVEFYNRDKKIGEDASAPYTINFKESETGNYFLTARAFDANGNIAVSDTVRVTVNGVHGKGRIYAEGYATIEGSRVADLMEHPFFPDDPMIVTTIDKLEYGPALGDNYGVRLRGYISAPQTGDYIFHIAGDDRCELWLSTDEDPTNKIKIAFVDPWVLFRAWSTYPFQKSAPVRLLAGARYYIETLHKEYVGPDYLSVGWTLPNGIFEGPITGKNLSPWEPTILPQRVIGGTLNFTNVTGSQDEFAVRLLNNPSRNFFLLKINSARNKTMTINVRDGMGRLIDRKSNIAANGTLQFGDQYQAGIYFAEISQGDKRQILKLIKQ